MSALRRRSTASASMYEVLADTSLQREMAFEEKLKALMGEYGIDLTQ